MFYAFGQTNESFQRKNRDSIATSNVLKPILQLRTSCNRQFKILKTGQDFFSIARYVRKSDLLAADTPPGLIGS